MLARVLLHVIAAAFGVDGAAHLRSGRNNLVHSMPDFALLIFVNVFDSSFERDARLGLRADNANIERLPTACWIERSAVELHRPTRLIAIAPKLLNVKYVGGEVEEERVVVVEALSHERSFQLPATSFQPELVIEDIMRF